MKSEENKGEILDIELKREGSTCVPITGVFGAINPDFAQLTLYNDILVPSIKKDGKMYPTSIERQVILETVLSVQTFTSIAHWMMQKVAQLEKFERDTKAEKDNTVETESEE